MLAGTPGRLPEADRFDMGSFGCESSHPVQQESPWRPPNGIPEVTNAWLSLAHDEFGAHAGPVARRRHPDFLRTVQFVLPGVARARRL